jgi:2-amino-4-hydroxy-6-hydroxymethyldihydropteridine diphosphokinase
MAKVYLGLGSNLGKREHNIQSAIAQMSPNHIDVWQISSFMETNPVGGPPQGKFLNIVVQAWTPLTPDELLTRLQFIEKNLGRERTVRNGPRTIDIDILLYDEMKIDLPHLKIPHPRMLEREFVMSPLTEIAPDVANELKKQKRS